MADNCLELSVIIPVYNSEPYIRQCYQNIKKQTFTEFEAIFVDDGSDDNSLSVIQECVKEDYRFSCIHKENGGAASARNAGLDKATGKYILFLDCDDEYSVDMFQKLIVLANEKEYDLVVCGFYFIITSNKNGKEVVNYLEKKNYQSCYFSDFEEIIPQYIDIWDSDMFSNVWNKLYKKETIDKNNIRFREGHVYTEDRVFNRSFLSVGPSLAITEECLYYYHRERLGSVTEKYRKDLFDIRHKEYEEFQVHFQQMHIWNDISKEYVNREFIERVAGCIENAFHAKKNELTVKEKYAYIDQMINNDDVQVAAHYARCKSVKMRLIVLPLKWKWTMGSFLIGYSIYIIRKMNPSIFHKLKSKR